MFKIFFLKELGDAFKRPMVYIFMFVIALLVFFSVVSDSVQIGGSVGNVNRNAPYIITTFVTVLSVFGLLIAAAFFNNAALRDYSHNFNEILFSSPINKAGYFFGRFFGALILACVPMLGVYLGILIGSGAGVAFGWIEAKDLGPFYLETFVNNFLLFILPNMFLAGAITFALANKFKSTVISFIGVIVVMVGYIISGTLLSDIENQTIAALSDPFGTRAYTVVTQYFTPVEKNSLSPMFEGLLLQNRLIYLGIGVAILLLSYFTFSFAEKQSSRKKTEKVKKESNTSFSLPVVHQFFNGNTAWQQFRSFFRVDFISIVKSTTFKILFFFTLVMIMGELSEGFEYFGLQSYPVTYKMVDVISNNASIFVIIIIVFFSGELVWRDRENKINEVIDASPFNSLPSLFAKTFALFCVTLSLYLFGVLIGVVYQLIEGYSNIEFGVYFGAFFYRELALYAVTSALLVFIQVIVNNKYLGYFVSVLYLFLVDLLLILLEVNSNLLSIGATPTMIYSDMNGFGPAAEAVLWFNAHWMLFGVLLLMISGLLLKRGQVGGRKETWAIAKRNFKGTFAKSFYIVLVLWLAVVSFVFYNIHVLNKTPSSDAREKLAADYEKKYKQYQKVAQPKLLAANYEIDIFPKKRDVKANIAVSLINTTDQAIDSLHFTVDENWNHKINIAGSDLVLNDEEIGYQIYRLSSPMMPGDTILALVSAAYISKGFENEVSNTSVIRNGTFLNNFQILPGLGYSEGFELGDNDTRKKYDLPDKERSPKLVADCGPECDNNYLSDGKSDWVNVETIISTSSDQIAIAPGSLIEEWEEEGRKYFRYRVDHPSQNFYAFISADYQIAKRDWNGISLEVYYDEKHEVNVEKMLNALQKSMKYYTENFGSYFHKQARIIEFPRYATFAQAFPGTMPYSEAFGFIINLENEDKNNVVDAVIAHEMGHQWWAHQEVSANMQGGTMLTESFSEYSSLMVMSEETSPLKMKDFVKYDMDRYLSGRSAETVKELPLYKVENQGYIHYGKGAVILYALQDYIGKEKVNNALRNFLDEYRYSTPYPTSLDFLRYLEPEVPDSLNYLIDDWFKEITLYDNRLTNASVEKLTNGKFKVTMDIEAYKIKADTVGNETRVDLNDWIDIGIYADSEESDLILEKRVKFNESNFQLTFEVDRQPLRAAIDPRRILIERVYTDNVKRLEEK
ncbi:M1 family aminopeptidase [uncultured Roseivirga sp.]|uniref:ABC transporter permease/M1 family aminopeptidase n=1 Tax=uncultured Roseivirga sp. TaxID=543088 RepID=UPI0030DB8BAA|tara:strand:+ start:1180 stop:4752 length:3573 start_codon:yes stop_codon:yes gene_type:complete